MIQCSLSRVTARAVAWIQMLHCTMAKECSTNLVSQM